jgi:archaemetzincin
MRGNVILPHPKPTASMPHLNNLNDRQHQAVISKDKRLLVLAGAGSGKTKTLLPKIICPIEEKGVSPSSIPANTFRLTIWHHAVSKLSCLSIVALFLSCNKPAPRQAAHKPPAPPVRICIQPFTGISEAEVNHVAGRIRGFYHSVKVLPAIELPAKAYYAPRNRHKADSLLQFLGSYKNDIGLTSQDISTRKNDVSDYGVMGLGYCPGKACVASSFRLNRKNKAEQLFKVAIHELGHSQGLPHCKNKSCFMRDADGKNPTDEETAFCASCTLHLRKKGWKL